MITGALLGGLSSLLVNGFKEGLNFFKAKQDKQHEITLLQMQIDARAAETEREERIAEHVAFSQVRQASYENDSAVENVSVWVNNVIKLMRPVITVYLIVLLTILGIMAFVAGPTAAAFVGIVATVEELCAMAISWWFGDRTISKFRK